MTTDHGWLAEPAMLAAISELQGLIRRHYPDAVFQAGAGEDPDGVYLRATVEVDDRDEVVETFIGRLVDLQVEEGLPIYVLINRPPERNAALRHAMSSQLASATIA